MGLDFFARAAESARAAVVPKDLNAHEIAAPTNLSPNAIAFMGDVTGGVGNFDRGTGRLVLLDDPDLPAGWDGRSRAILYAQAPLETDIGDEMLVVDVAWAWLLESLAAHGATYAHASGTVTKVVSTGFGEMSEQGRGSQLEIRASWSPLDDNFQAHVEAWAQFVCTLAGFPPLPDGVVPMVGR
ncbi:hypothetical protein C8A06_1425 [Microbacteriaceae bacterium MWH-Ta3]|nr:hypothetical protein C8A06_1425 [Microbacteriaceae bacterium MWH-Ta3]